MTRREIGGVPTGAVIAAVSFKKTLGSGSLIRSAISTGALKALAVADKAALFGIGPRIMSYAVAVDAVPPIEGKLKV